MTQTRKLSLKSLLICQLLLGAMIPALLLSSLLISEFRAIQTEEQIKKQRAQTEKAILHVEFELEKLSLQLQQLSENSNAALATSSGIFAQNARNSLVQIAAQHSLAKAVLLVDTASWIVEAVPVEAMLLSMTPLQPSLSTLLAQDYAAKNSTFILSSAELAETLLPNYSMQNQYITEFVVIQIPLKLSDSTISDPRSKLTGIIVALLPLNNIKTLLEQYSPDATLRNIYWQRQGLINPSSNLDDKIITVAPLSVPGLASALNIEFATDKATVLSAITALTYRFAIITALFLFLLLAVGWFFVRLELKPIKALSRLVERYADGDLHQPRRHFPLSEFDKIAGVLHEMAVKLRENQELLESRVEQRTNELQRAVIELNQINTELVKTQQQLIESEKQSQIGILVAGVAREITAPITKSLSAVTALQQENLSIARAMNNSVLKRSSLENYLKESTLSIEQLSQHMRRAEELIQSFKAVAVDQSSEQRRNFNLYDYMQQILLSLRYELGQYRVKVDIKGDKIMVVQSYPGSFSRILTNLVLNSLQHGFDNETAQLITISFGILPDGNLQVIYSDDGRGMTKEVLARIFEPFFTTAQQTGGSGLGLSIVYNMVTQKLNGSLVCDSEPGKGCKFVLTLPVRIVIKHRTALVNSISEPGTLD